VINQTLAIVRQLIARQDVLVAAHGEEELANDGIALSELLDTIDGATVVEDYPGYAKGPCVLVLSAIPRIGRFTYCGVSAKTPHGLRC
jgi:hypothetical protein